MRDRPGSGDRTIVLELKLMDDELERLAVRIAELLSVQGADSARWLDVREAARHLGLTPASVRGLVKRGRIPVHRTEHGRLRFSVTELDHWVRTGSCAATNEDLP
jgi:excisionase family DNA binding protein